jgi:hypothetical protein
VKNSLSFEALSYRDNTSILEAIESEHDNIGYYTLPNQETASILEYTNTLSKNIESVVIIGIGGIITGVILGFIGMYVLANFDIITLPADVYATSKLPLVLNNSDLFYILFGSSFIVLASSYYPAYKATKIDVLDVLRNE